MTDSEAQQPESTPAPKTGGPSRRGRRGGRGRGRGGRNRAPQNAQPGTTTGVENDNGTQSSPGPATDSLIESSAPASGQAVESPAQPLPLLERVTQLASRVVAEPKFQISAVTQAIDEVTAIIEKLKGAVEQMEEVLELVELAERQKIADEREIETLRRQLRRIHQPQERREPYREQRRDRHQERQSEPTPEREPENPHPEHPEESH